MIEGIEQTEKLNSIARQKRQGFEFKTIRPSHVEEYTKDGWQVARKNRTSIRMKRPKSKHRLFEDRVWSLLYRMGFDHMSGQAGAKLPIAIGAPTPADNQIDVVAIDDEVAIGVECKSAVSPRKPADFQGALAKFAAMRNRFTRAIHRQFPRPGSQAPVLIFWTWDLILPTNAEGRAQEANVILLDEADLTYYEELTKHLGHAAKYQLFADIMPSREIGGLRTKLPALRSKMGKHVCYTFSVKPAYLLKLAYVSHRAKGKATDIDTYQRMIKKSRLKKIKNYISRNGIFPTNIVLNLEGKNTCRFDRAPKQEGHGADYGYLSIKPTYGCAWVIDGQHRLFAYADSSRADTSHLNVLAFDKLPASRQAELFIDINHEQKSVKRSLLIELFAELNWDSEDEEKRISAVVSKASQALEQQIDSPFHERILMADDTRTSLRCISIQSIFRALIAPGMFVIKAGEEYGPLWRSKNDLALPRVILVINRWFGWIAQGAKDWWAAGSGDRGGLAMNDGVVVCVNVLRSVFRHLQSRGLPLVRLDDTELVAEIKPFGESLGSYLGSLNDTEREGFRAARGIQGQTAMRRRCEAAIHKDIPGFNPPGLEEALRAEKEQTNKKGYEIIQRVERRLKAYILDALRSEYEDGNLWWYECVPSAIRKKAVDRLDDQQGRGSREDYLDLIDYRPIILSNWQLFQNVLAHGQTGNKDKKTEWIVKTNELRKIAMHGSRGFLSLDELAYLRGIDSWLDQQVTDRPAEQVDQ